MNLSVVLSDTEVTAYERELAEHLNLEHVVAVSSGTAALQTALDSVGVQPGDDVLVPALGVVMSVAPVVHLGARPVFVDCDSDGIDFDYDDLARKTTERTTAVVPVYLWGRAGDSARVRRFADEHGLAVVVDACQALGTTVNGMQAGLDGNAACFSTHKWKLLSTDEGGFVATWDSDVTERARAFRSHWLSPPTGHQPLSRLAHNFRLAEPLAAIGRRELTRIEMYLQQRADQTTLLQELLADLPQVRPLTAPTGQGWNHYAPLLQLRLDQPRAFSEHLAAHGVPNSTGTYRLIPLDRRPMFADDTPPTCTTAAHVLDEILAVVLTRDDDEQTIRRYADTIAMEVTRWASA